MSRYTCHICGIHGGPTTEPVPEGWSSLNLKIVDATTLFYCPAHGGQLQRCIFEFNREQRWTAYREKLLHDPELPPAQREGIARALNVLDRAEPTMKHPTVTRVDGEVALSWNPPGLSLDITIKPTGALSWFFVNHATGYDAEGEDEGYANYAVQFRYEAP